MRYFAQHYRGGYEILKEENGKIHLRSPYPTDFEESSRIVLYTFPSNGKRSLLFVHGLGRYNMKFLTYFPRWFSKRGFNSALMILPYHFDRTPEGYKSGELFTNTTENSILRSRFEHAVVDVLTSLDFLEERFGPAYLMGYSFGGMISTIAAAFRKVQALSLVVTGGNFLHITWESVATKVFRIQYEKNEECDVEKCRYWHSKENFYKYIEELESPKIELDTAPMQCYEYDPLVFAKFVRSPVVFFRALFDMFIPSKSSTELFRMLGTEKKKMYTLPTGHIGSFLVWRSFIAKKTLEFFEKKKKHP